VPDQFKLCKTLNLLGLVNTYGGYPVKAVTVLDPPATDGEDDDIMHEEEEDEEGHIVLPPTVHSVEL